MMVWKNHDCEWVALIDSWLKERLWQWMLRVDMDAEKVNSECAVPVKETSSTQVILLSFKIGEYSLWEHNYT